MPDPLTCSASSDFAKPVESHGTGEVFFASPLFRPAVTRWRKGGSSKQSNAKIVRSMRPISRKESARPDSRNTVRQGRIARPAAPIFIFMLIFSMLMKS